MYTMGDQPTAQQSGCISRRKHALIARVLVAFFAVINLRHFGTNALAVADAAVPVVERDPKGNDNAQINFPKKQSKFTKLLRGKASWYGPRFHGRKTASGDVFDQRKLTAAHKTLPLGSKAIVTNLENGNSVEVEINDRGPYARGRIIDVSYAAAKRLGFAKSGTAPVQVEPLPEVIG
jgi:rare lipoprotein A